MATLEVPRSAVPALWVLTTLAGAIFLRTASELFIPIVVAVLASYALEPIVRRLHAISIPRVIGAGLLLAVLVAGGAAVLYTIRADIAEVAAAMPRAMRRLGEWMGATTVAREAERTVRSAETIQLAAGWVAAAAGQMTIVVFLTYFLLIAGHTSSVVSSSLPAPGWSVSASRSRSSTTSASRFSASCWCRYSPPRSSRWRRGSR